MKIATIQLKKKQPSIIEKVDTVIDPTEYINNIKLFQNIGNKEITIYDLTKTTKANNNDNIYVSDHINQTGHNPLIGNQKNTNTTFIDISHKYKSTSGVTTHCLGHKFHKHHKGVPYPSYYLCHIYILAIAMGVKTIDARLINVL